LPPGGGGGPGGGPGGGAALGAALGGAAVTAGGALVFDVSCEELHMATHTATKAMTAPSAICVRRVFNDKAGTDLISDHTFSPPPAITPAGRGFHAAPVRSDGNLSQPEPGSATLAGLLGLAAFAVDSLS
jgi:hypothetical protein